MKSGEIPRAGKKKVQGFTYALLLSTLNLEILAVKIVYVLA